MVGWGSNKKAIDRLFFGLFLFVLICFVLFCFCFLLIRFRHIWPRRIPSMEWPTQCPSSTEATASMSSHRRRLRGSRFPVVLKKYSGYHYFSWWGKWYLLLLSFLFFVFRPKNTYSFFISPFIWLTHQDHSDVIDGIPCDVYTHKVRVVLGSILSVVFFLCVCVCVFFFFLFYKQNKIYLFIHKNNVLFPFHFYEFVADLLLLFCISSSPT